MGSCLRPLLLKAAQAEGDRLHRRHRPQHRARGRSRPSLWPSADLSLPRVIPGIELSTADGEIIGLYVWEDIPAGFPSWRLRCSIRGQGGLIYLPHPYDLFRRGAISRGERSRAAELSDIIEVVNGRSLGPLAGRKAREAGHTRWASPEEPAATLIARRRSAWPVSLVEAYPSRDTLVSLVAAGVRETRS